MTLIDRILLRAVGKPVGIIVRPYFRRIFMTLETLEARLQGIADNLAEASVEIVDEIAKLREQLDNAGQLTDGARELLDRIETKAQALADIVPDAAEPEEPEEPGGGEEPEEG